jgi:hypothetical protein
LDAIHNSHQLSAAPFLLYIQYIAAAWSGTFIALQLHSIVLLELGAFFMPPKFTASCMAKTPHLEAESQGKQHNHIPSYFHHNSPAFYGIVLQCMHIIEAG